MQIKGAQAPGFGLPTGTACECGTVSNLNSEVVLVALETSRWFHLRLETYMLKADFKLPCSSLMFQSYGSEYRSGLGGLLSGFPCLSQMNVKHSAYQVA